MGDHLLGIDLGSTSIKAGIFAPDRTAVQMFGETYLTHRTPGGICEQNPDDWMRLIDKAFAQFRDAGLTARVGRGALTSQVNTHVFVDRHGQPLAPAILWQDTRAAAEASELDARLSDADKSAWLGAPIPIDASHCLARMLWMQRHHPDIWDKTAHVLLPKDYALFKLTGDLATDPLSNVGLVGLDGRYVTPILDLVPGAADRMAPIRGLTEIMGETSDGIAMATATMDGWVGLFGAGACRPGAFAYLSGTSEILGAASATVTNEPGVVVFSEIEGVRLHAGPTQSGGATQQWLCDLTGLTIPQIVQMLDRSGRQPTTPLFLPHLAGERAPLWNADLRGAFLGMETGAGTGDLVRAVYEGIGFSARHLLEALEASTAATADTLLCGGGGFKSGPLAQIRADVLGKRLKRLAINEPGVVGAASIAAASDAAARSLTEAHAPFARFDHSWEPDPARRGFYDDLFGLYKEALEINATLGHRISTLRPQT
ncbi:MAG: FGGY-family carbohydrate kinase [Pseudomonadota bacterium]